jgi:glycine betaine catabolism B
MSPIRVTRLLLDSIARDGRGALALNFRPRRRLRFTAGQHDLWIVPGGGVAPFTVASAPEEELVTLGTSVTSQTRLKRALAALTAGDMVRFVGPIGRFTVEGAARSVVMLGQGLGVTPFRAMLRHLALAGQDTATTLVHVGATHPFRADTESIATRAVYPSSRDAFARELTRVAADQPDATFLVSGSRAFVSATATSLQAHQVDPTLIRRDTFWGYRIDHPASAPAAVPSS